MNVHGRIAISEEAAQEPQLVGKISLRNRDVECSRKGGANTVIISFNVRQCEWQ